MTGDNSKIAPSRRGKPTSDESRKKLRVEVAYALPERQVLIALEVEEGTTALTAIERSGILQKFPQANPRRDGMGVFGKQVAPDMRLRDGDRVEIYRPLIADPKEARRKRAGKTPGRPRGR